jgi:hypothetical protein
MDAVFGGRSFANEVIWSYRRWPSPSNHFQRMHDVILFYAKAPSGPGTFNVEYEPNSPSYVRRFKGKTQMLDPATKSRKITLDEDSRGLARRDVWDISIIAGYSKQRLGYPTQKPEALLERIIKVSSNEGDLVLDPFCGCGTAVAVAQKLNRRWIGIDITHLAITLIKHRLRDSFGELEMKDGKVQPAVEYDVVGEPVAVADARRLAEEDPYQFQWWALGLVGARPAEGKRGADKGIDGRIYFHEDPEGKKTRQIVLSVKGGHTGVAHVRDLRGVVERENAEIGVLITLEKPTRPMLTEATEGAYYDSPTFGRFPRIQVLTVEELLEGKGIEYPRAMSATFKKAPKAERGKAPKQTRLDDSQRA